MSNTVFSALSSIFSSLWYMLGQFAVPGTSLTGQHLLVAPLGAVVFITALKKILDIGAAGPSSAINMYRESSRAEAAAAERAARRSNRSKPKEA